MISRLLLVVVLTLGLLLPFTPGAGADGFCDALAAAGAAHVQLTKACHGDSAFAAPGATGYVKNVVSVDGGFSSNICVPRMIRINRGDQIVSPIPFTEPGNCQVIGEDAYKQID